MANQITGCPVTVDELRDLIIDQAAGSLSDTQAAAVVLVRFPGVSTLEMATASIGLVRDRAGRPQEAPK